MSMAPNTCAATRIAIDDRPPNTIDHRVEEGLRDENHRGVDDRGHDPIQKPAGRRSGRAADTGGIAGGRSSAAGADAWHRGKLGEIPRDVDPAARTRRAIDGLPAALRTCSRHCDCRILAHRAVRECTPVLMPPCLVSAAPWPDPRPHPVARATRGRHGRGRARPRARRGRAVDHGRAPSRQLRGRRIAVGAADIPRTGTRALDVVADLPAGALPPRHCSQVKRCAS